MYKVEYIILLNDDKARCKTVKSLKSLLESDSEIEIEKNKIKYKSYTTEINIQVGRNTDKAHTFFDITILCANQQDIENFSALLKAVRRCLSLLDRNLYVVWDDLSKYYAEQAYPIISEIENLMRQLISKFMLTNIGMGWTKDRIPNDVERSINLENKDSNYLNNVDFIQLKNILFSENFPQHKESLIKELREVKDTKNLKIAQIQTLLPESNWRRYFQPLVGCEARYLETRWESLYKLRCSVAHNKTFLETDLESVKKMSSELKPYLEKALANLPNIVIEEEQRDSLAENAAISTNEIYGRFLLKFRELESTMHSVVSMFEKNNNRSIHYPIRKMAEILVKHKSFSEPEFNDFLLINQFRNHILHFDTATYTPESIAHYEEKINSLLNSLILY